MTPKIKHNVEQYNRDVRQHHGYAYTVNGQFSSRVANERLTQATLAAIDPGTHTVIDVGCGDGHYTAQLQAACPGMVFTATDLAEEAIKIAGIKYPDIRFLVADLLDPKTLPETTFDLAVLRGVLHHTADPARVIKNIAGRARQLVIIEPNGNNLILKMIEKLSQYHRDHEEQSFFPRTIERWCREAGYEIQSLEYAGFVPFFFPTLPARLIYTAQPWLEKTPIVKHLFSAVSVIKTCKRRV